MTILFTSGFENNFESWAQAGSPIIINDAHSGSLAMRMNTVGSGVYKNLNTPYPDLFVRFYVRFPTIPTVGSNWHNFFYLEDTDWANYVSLRLISEEGVTYWGLGTPTAGVLMIPATINAGQWYCVELERKTGTGNAVANLWIDGVNIGSVTTETMTVGSQIAYFYLGTPVTTDIDTVAIGDSYIGIEAMGISMTVASTMGGTTNPTGLLTLDVGVTYTFTAIPESAEGYVLDHWELAGASVGTSTTLNLLITPSMNGQTLTAVFTIPPTTIQLTVVATAGGSVAPSGLLTLQIGASYNFTATTNTNYVFTRWDLAGVTVGFNQILNLTATLAMNGQTLSAVFTPQTQNNGYIYITAVAGTTPINATVAVDGQSGITPRQFTLAAGTYTVVATYQNTTLPAQTVSVVANQTTTITLQFPAQTTTVTLTIAAGAGGSVAPSGTFTLAINQTYSAVPAVV